MMTEKERLDLERERVEKIMKEVDELGPKLTAGFEGYGLISICLAVQVLVQYLVQHNTQEWEIAGTINEGIARAQRVRESIGVVKT